MRAINLYGTADRDVASRVMRDDPAIVYEAINVSGHGCVYVRAELVEVDEIVETIDKMNPLDGETFLNGISA